MNGFATMRKMVKPLLRDLNRRKTALQRSLARLFHGADFLYPLP
jgi:hypothetical protein